jgi:hypothetical protein
LTRSGEQKECPECGVINPETNIFCPQCGFCFIDEKKEAPTPEKKRLSMEVEKNKRLIWILAVLIVALAIIAGVASFFISMEIQRSTLVTVQTGTRWKCLECGKFYKNRVLTIDVEKAEREKYGIETVEGTCYTCRYGEMVGEFADWIELLDYNGYFSVNPAEMSQESAEFISVHPELFPAAELEQVKEIATDVDPRKVEHDYADFTGKLIHIKGRVTKSEDVVSEAGDEITLVGLKPEVDGRELDINFVVLYSGTSDVLRGDIADCYLLPIDLVKYKEEGKESNAVITIAAFLTVQ